MATSKSKKTKKSTEKPKTTNSKSEVTVVEEVVTVAEPTTVEKKTVEEAKEIKVKGAKKNDNPFAGFFARKSDPNENILTIFRNHRIWGAILGELIGTMFMTALLLTLGIYQPLYIFFGIIGITMAVYGLSGARG